MFLTLQIDCCIKLSGMPDLSLSFMNPRLFDDVSFHPCVRFKRWEVSENYKKYFLYFQSLFDYLRLFRQKGFYRSYHLMGTLD